MQYRKRFNERDECIDVDGNDRFQNTTIRAVTGKVYRLPRPEGDRTCLHTNACGGRLPAVSAG